MPAWLLAMVRSATSTVIVAVAAPPVMGTNVPVPSSNVAVTLLVTLFFVPALVAVTLMEKEHAADGFKLSAVMLIVLLPGLAITLPVTPALGSAQPLGRPLGDATTSPLGRVSVNEIFVIATLLGLAMVKVSVVVPFPMVAAPKALARVGGGGGGVTFRLAVLLVAPGPLSLAEIGPVVLFRVAGAAAVACTFTEMKHDPLAMGGCAGLNLDAAGRRAINPAAGPKLPPERLMEEESGTAVTVPPQSLLTLLGDATTRPAGKASVN